jgi:hypothetical protein
MIELHAEGNGKKGGLVFEVEGNQEELVEVMRQADQVVKAWAKAAHTPPNEFAINVLRDLPTAANRKDEPKVRHLMELASLSVVMNSPNREAGRAIRNCSLWVRNDKVDVYIFYLD